MKTTTRHLETGAELGNATILCGLVVAFSEAVSSRKFTTCPECLAMLELRAQAFANERHAQARGGI